MSYIRHGTTRGYLVSQRAVREEIGMLGEVDVGELELWSDEDSEGPTTPRADLGRGTGLEARPRNRTHG